MLDGTGDVIEHVVKRLAIPVGQYLEMGSPSQDYKVSASIFHRIRARRYQYRFNVPKNCAHFRERRALGAMLIETNTGGSYCLFAMKWEPLQLGEAQLWLP